MLSILYIYLCSNQCTSFLYVDTFVTFQRQCQCYMLSFSALQKSQSEMFSGSHSASFVLVLICYFMLVMQGERDGIWAWQRINQLFNWLPLAALIERKIICMHGGIGRSINHVHQIEALQRPITMEAGSVVLMDLLWYVLSTSYSLK